MNGNSDPEQKNIAATTGSDSSPLQPATTGTAPDAEEKKRRQQKLEEARHNALKDVPLVGSFLVWAQLQFGWTGIVLLLAGFLVAVILIYAGLLPKRLIAEVYKTAPLPQRDRGYELIPDPEVALSQALKNAQFNVEVSGVAVSAINLNTLKEKIEHGFSADIVILDPCSDAVQRRTEDTGHISGASRNILKVLEGMKSYWEQLPEDKKKHLQVRLSKRPATMVVAMFDRRRELYAYWCRYGAPCTKSHVLVFKNYGEKNPENTVANEAGLFFENHYDAVFRDAGQPLDFNAYNPGIPCPAQSSEGSVQH
jgi:hypothetical protein